MTDYLITDFGAQGDGTSLDTHAIQAPSTQPITLAVDGWSFRAVRHFAQVPFS